MKNRKGFTLIELLAVIVILGILLLVAIPSVTRYINDSRKDSYIATAKQYIKSATNMVNGGEFDVYDPTITYYIPAKCIPLETGGQSPYGDFDRAYVVVTYDGNGFRYYWQSRDVTGMGIPKATLSDDLTKDSVKAGVKRNEVKTTDTLDNTYRVNVLSEESCKLEHANDNFAFLVNEDDMVTDEYELIPQNSLTVSTVPNVQFYAINGVNIGNLRETVTGAYSGQYFNKVQYGTVTYTDSQGYKRTKMFYSMPKYRNKKDDSIHSVAKIVWIQFFEFTERDDTIVEYGYACIAHDANQTIVDCDVNPVFKHTGCSRSHESGCLAFSHNEPQGAGLYAILDNNAIVSLYHPQVHFNSLFSGVVTGMPSNTWYSPYLVQAAVVQ